MGAKKRETRTQKGCVATENHRNRIRLRWGYQGKRYYLYTGLPYTPAALKVAQQTASKIELDMLSGHFDETLVAYGKKPDKSSVPTVVEVFQRYTDYKAKFVQPKTLWSYKGIINALDNYFGTKPSHPLTKSDVEGFVEWYKTTNLESHIQRDRLVKISGAWDWAIGEKLVESNPWQGASKLVKVPPKPQPKPFTQAEVAAIKAPQLPDILT